MAAENRKADRYDQGALGKAIERLYGPSRTGNMVERYTGLSGLVADDMQSLVGAAGGDQRFYSAPGRTELGGNHTDHNRGHVLCAAVDLDTAACVSPIEGKRIVIRSEGYERPIIVDIGELGPRPEERGSTEALIRGVAGGLADRGIAPRAFVGRVHSRVLPGSGLSSSAAFEVLMAGVLADLAGVELPAMEVARIGQFAENRYFGKPCGLMDQAASAVGGVVAIDFGSMENPGVTRIDYDFAAKGLCLAVVNTGGSHADLTEDYASIPREMRAVAALFGVPELRDVDPRELEARGPEIRSACGDRAFLRALHFMADDARVTRMAAALAADDLAGYLELVRESGASSWQLLQNLYAPAHPTEQGLCVALALCERTIADDGAWRVHGGGFAGTVQAYLPGDRLAEFTALMERYFGAGCVLPLTVRRMAAGRLL